VVEHPEHLAVRSGPSPGGGTSSGWALAGQLGQSSWSGPKVSIAGAQSIVPKGSAIAAVPTGHWQVGKPPRTTQEPASPQE
jgi:hypothetical protein